MSHHLTQDNEDILANSVDIGALETRITGAETGITNLLSQTSGVGTSGLKLLINNNTSKISYPSVKNTFLYGKRIRMLSAVNSATPDTISIPASLSSIVFQNTIENGDLAHESSTGLILCSHTGLYKVKAKLQFFTNANDERLIQVGLYEEDNTQIVLERTNLPRLESSSTFTSVDMNVIVRLVSGTKYRFKVSSNASGVGVIHNAVFCSVSLDIEGMALPTGYTLASNWGTL